MTRQYLFMFSKGEYSDYAVGGMYSCDHKVTKAEYEEYISSFKDKLSELERKVPRVAVKTGLTSSGSGMYRYTDDKESSEYQEYQKFKEFFFSKNLDEGFRELHNMQPVQYLEFWRY